MLYYLLGMVLVSVIGALCAIRGLIVLAADTVQSAEDTAP